MNMHVQSIVDHPMIQGIVNVLAFAAWFGRLPVCFVSTKERPRSESQVHEFTIHTVVG